MIVKIVQLRGNGNLTIPLELRQKYGFIEEDEFTLIDLGGGAILLTPRASQINRLGDRVAEKLAEEGVSLDDLLQTLDEERERYYREHYVGD